MLDECEYQRGEAPSDGEHAYNAYLESSGGKSLVSGVSLPAFSQLSERIRTAWEHVATKLRDHFRSDILAEHGLTEDKHTG